MMRIPHTANQKSLNFFCELCDTVTEFLHDKHAEVCVRAHVSVQACVWASLGECQCVHCFIMLATGRGVISEPADPSTARDDFTSASQGFISSFTPAQTKGARSARAHTRPAGTAPSSRRVRAWCAMHTARGPSSSSSR